MSDPKTDTRPIQTPSLNRRRFLKRTVAAAAGATGLPYVISSSAMGAGNVAPSNRITLGFIGMGKMMSGHLGGFLGKPGVQVVAVCDVESRRMLHHQRRVDDYYTQHRGKGTYKGCAAYRNFLALVERPDIDAVVIATPDHWHTLNSLAAIRRGKDVYCEKPLTLTINEGKVLTEAVRRYSRVFQTGSQQRSEWQFRLACELVRNGRIGKVHTVHVNVGGPPQDCRLPAHPVPNGLDWDFWLGPAPYRPYNADIAPGMDYAGWPNFRAYRDYSGGGMTDWGAHHFDIAQWGLGMDGSGPVEITPPDDKGHSRLTYKYANGIVMTHGGAAGRAGVEFVGETGRVLVNRGYIETKPADILDGPIGPNDLHLHPSGSHQDNWLACVRSRSTPICDVEIGHRSVTVCHLGNIAYWLKRPLKWDPVKEEFVNDDEATRLMQRPMRAPWRLV